MNVSLFLPTLLPTDTQPLTMCAVAYSTARTVLRRVFCSACARVSLAVYTKGKKWIQVLQIRRFHNSGSFVNVRFNNFISL